MGLGRVPLLPPLPRLRHNLALFRQCFQPPPLPTPLLSKYGPRRPVHGHNGRLCSLFCLVAHCRDGYRLKRMELGAPLTNRAGHVSNYCCLLVGVWPRIQPYTLRLACFSVSTCVGTDQSMVNARHCSIERHNYVQRQTCTG